MELYNKISNPFWKETVMALYQLHKITYPDSDMDIYSEPLWYNPMIQNELPVGWYNKGLRFIGDLYNIRGEVKTIETLENEFNIKLNFLTYESLRRSIPNEWQAIMNQRWRSAGIEIPTMISTLYRQKKGCTYFYNCLKKTQMCQNLKQRQNGRK